MKKLEIKPGRSVSAIGIMMGIMGTVFGIFWIGMVLHLSHPWDDPMETGVVFLLVFGMMFVIAIIVITSFYVKNTFGKNRPSMLDIEVETEGEINGAGTTGTRTNHDGENNFCAYCGKPVKKEFSYCQACGKKIIA